MSLPAVTMSTSAWIIFVNFATFIWLAVAETRVVDILMPDARPTKDDSYLCYPMEFSETEVYITKFEAIAHSDVAHHMILFGCEDAVVSQQPVYCNQICSRGKYILYAWARNAPPVHMPEGVATAVGGKIRYLNLQIHYLHGFSREAEPDRSGVKLTITDQRPQYLAGIFLMLSNVGNIPPDTNEYAIDVTCQYPESKLVIHPFAYRVHSHTLGHVISAFKYYNGTYEKLGKGNPMWPQAFYPMDQVHTVSPGDTLVARCVYNSTLRHRQTVLGSTHNDEMCNFYIMYYSSHPMQKQSCDGNKLPQVALNLPQDSLIPMEPNPELDAMAEGHHHHHPQNTVGDADAEDHDGDTEAGKDADIEQKADIWRGRYYGDGFGVGDDDDDGGGLRDVGKNVNHNVASLRNHGYLSGIDRRNYGKPIDYNQPQYDYEYPGEISDGSDDTDRDYFYYQVLNQRSRNRHPDLSDQQGQYDKVESADDKLNTDAASAYFKDMQQRRQNKIPSQGSSLQSSGNQEALSGGPIRSQLAEESTNQNGYHTEGRESIHHSSLMNGHAGAKLPGTTTVRKSGANEHVIFKGDKKISSSLLSTGVREDVSWSVSGVKLGQVAGVAVDSVGHAHVFHRGTRVWDANSFDRNDRFVHETDGPIKENTVVAFDSNGNATQQWGSHMFYMPHGLHMDHSDNIYITDVALHQVMRFPAGQHQADLTLGEEFQPGSDDHHFCMPTDVAVLSSGEFFVSDGYCNGRILKFSSTGQLLLKWGSKSLSIDGVYPPPATFVIPHSLTLMAEQQQLCVSDRGNARLQIFSLTGDFIRQIHPVEIGGQYYAASYSQVNGALYVVNGLDAYEPDTAVRGYTILMSNTSVTESWGPRNQSFQRPHDIAVDSTGRHLYVTEIGPNTLWRLSISQPSHSSKGLHQSVKKDHSFHPQSVDSSEDSEEEEQISRVTEQEAGDFGVSLMIGALLVVPVVIVIIITIIVRLRKNGKLRFFTHNSKHNRRFNLGNFFRRHRGFDRVRTDGDPELDHLNSDSEIEEYNATGNLKA